MAGAMLFATHSGLGERCYEDIETERRRRQSAHGWEG
jgi:hypothetical protein